MVTEWTCEYCGRDFTRQHYDERNDFDPWHPECRACEVKREDQERAAALKMAAHWQAVRETVAND